MEGTGDDLVLLLLGEVVEVHRIARHADGELRILLGMLLRIEQRVTVEHVNVQVLATLLGLRVDHVNEVVGLRLGDVGDVHVLLLFEGARQPVAPPH